MNNSLVGILGGMGPLASSAFVNFLYQKCQARFTQEQSYPRIILLSDPTIPDRMASINHRECFKELVDILNHHVEKLLSVGARQILLCCFTAHYFLPFISFESQKIIINLPELLAAHLNILSKPTLILGSELLTRSQLIASAYAVYPEEIYFAKIHQLIYNIKLNGALPVYQHELTLFAQSLARRYGVAQILFACTEFHLIYQQTEKQLIEDDTLDILDGLNVAADFILN